MLIVQRICAVWLILLFLIPAYTSQNLTDSLLNQFNQSSSETEKYALALALSENLIYLDIEEAKSFLQEAKSYATKSNKPDYISEVNLYEFEILSAENKDNECVALMIQTIDYCKKNNVTKNLAHAYNKLGAIYFKTELIDKALEYFNMANEVFKSIDDARGQRNSLNNIGAILYYQDKYEEAITYFDQSFEIESSIGDKEGMSTSLANIGGIYCKLDPPQFSIAEEKLIQSLEIANEINNPDAISSALINLSYLYIQSNDLEKAKVMLDQSLVISKNNNIKDNILNALENKLEVFQLENDFESALSVSLEIQELESELYSAENTKTMAELEAIYQNKEKQKENEVLVKKGELDQVKLSYEKQKSIYLIIGLLAVAALAGLAFNRFLVSQKRKKVIEKQKEEVELQKEMISEQKILVEEKNQEISDSITYAKRIQSAILPHVDSLNEYLGDGFLFFKPKDIVSGDFYWMHVLEDYVLFAVADCTGHGVPGAMVSVVCNNALNRSIREYKLRAPGEILNKTRELVIETFNTNMESVRDGMDISFCALNRTSLELSWSGANNPLWVLHRESLEMMQVNPEKVTTTSWNGISFTELFPNKQPIGKQEKSEPFATHTLQLKPGSEILIFSDGYADQFGGPNGKKMKYKLFKQLVFDIFHLEMSEQKERLSSFFEEWKGSYEQLDDVCVIGVRV